MAIDMQATFEMWWEKLINLRNKFCRETYLIGYEREDLEQECYFIFLEACAQYDEEMEVSFPSYYKVKLYGWRANMNRKIKRNGFSLLADEDSYSEEGVSTENETITRLVCQVGMRKLSQVEYDLIYEFYFNEKSLKEVACQLGISYKSAEKRKKQALDKLKKYI